MVAGVSLGLARYYDIDPVIFRIVFAVLAIFGGVGVVLYAIGWLLMPEEGAPRSHVEAFVERHRRPGVPGWIVAALVVVLLIWGASQLARAHPGGIVGGAILVGLALLIAQAYNHSRAARTTTAEPSAMAAAGAVPASDTATVARPVAETAPLAEPVSRPRSALGLLTVSAALLAVGFMTALGIAGVTDPRPADVVAVALAVVGVGLLVGTVLGRSWGLIPLGVLLIGLLAFARGIPTGVPWSSGHRVWTPTVADLHPRYALGAGDARLDLTKLDPSASPSLSVRMGAGRLVVVVPTDVTVDLHSHTSAGRTNIVGRENDGFSLDDQEVLPPIGRGTSAGTLSLDLRMGYGDIEIRRVQEVGNGAA